MAPTLQTLSSEVLLDLFELMNTEEIYRLGLCSRAFYKVTIPFLYRTLRQTRDNALQGFTRQILRFPELGNHVKFLIASSRPYDMVLDMSAFNFEDLARCEAAMHSVAANLFDVPPESSAKAACVEIWMNAFQLGSWDAIVGLFLTLIPDLRSIEMQTYSNYDYLYITKALIAARRNHFRGNTSAFPLKHLSSVSLAYSDTEGGLGEEAIITYLEVPTLRKAEVFRMSISSFDKVMGQDPLYNVTQLCLEQCVVGGNALINFLSSFPNLKSLHYDHGGWMIGESVFLPQKIGQAIAHLKPCLEELYLIDEFQGDSQDEEYEDEDEEGNVKPGPIGSLTEFERLHTLVLQHTTLFGTSSDDDGDDGNEHEIDDEDTDNADDRNPSAPRLSDLLPKSLRKLVLTGVPSGPDVLDQVREVAEKREEFPFLEGVNIGYWSRRPSAKDLEIKGESLEFIGCDKVYTDKLKADCKAVGVELRFSRLEF